MTEREKELEELVHRIVLKTFNKYREQLIKTIAKYLTEEGYTKKHFPVEKLKRWLNKCSLANAGVFFDKIKELEDG